MPARPAVIQGRQDPLFVGILRRDALFVPIAVNDGRDWWNAWPFSNESDESVQNLPLPESLDAIPDDWLPPGVRLPREWRVQIGRGGQRVIRLGRPARPSGYNMAAMIALRTDYPAPAKVNDAVDIDAEEGVAVAGPATLDRFARVTDETARALLAGVAADLDAAETREIAFRIKEYESAPDWNGKRIAFPANETQRKAASMSSYGFTRSVRADSAGTFYVFRGQKDHGRKPWPDCEATVDFSGIVVQDRSGRVSARSMGAYTTLDCSRDNAVNVGFEPLASLHWRGPTLWVVRLEAEDGFEYGLLDPAVPDPFAIQMKGMWQLRRNATADSSNK
jgi:hypothetical protein